MSLNTRSTEIPLIPCSSLAGRRVPSIHLNGAINTGLTKQELQEIFLQIGTYCGVPAAMDAFRLASEGFKEMGIE
jgi:alkylhydroperoxidase/carboxymuconolactone decarboxylase family protein YurZ